MDRYIQTKHNKLVRSISHQALEKNNPSKQTFGYNRRKQKKLQYKYTSYQKDWELFLFFLIKCKNIIDQKGAGDQQYKEKRNKVPWPIQKQDKLAE